MEKSNNWQIDAELYELPAVSVSVYNETPGECSLDKVEINRVLGGKHWSELLTLKLAKELPDEVHLITLDAFLLLLPAYILNTIEIIRDQRADLWHFIEALESRLDYETEPSNPLFVARVKAVYNERQISSLLDLLKQMNEKLSESGFAMSSELISRIERKLTESR